MTTPLIDRAALFNVIPNGLMILDTKLCFVEANDRYLALTKRKREDLLGRFVFDVFPEIPERMTSVANAFARALAGEQNVLEEQGFDIRQPDGKLKPIWWHCTQIPIFDGDGSVVGLMQQIHDISDRIAAERMRDVISKEYDHRVRNILAKVTAIARRTARGKLTIDEFLVDYEARVAAMARAHKLLVDSGWVNLNLAELVAAELKPYTHRKKDRIVMRGPPVHLASRIAQALGMALHELATNAVKHGALSHQDGKLKVDWTVNSGNGALTVNWRESDGPPPTHNDIVGFGSTIIDRVLPLETEGNVHRAFENGGLVCRIEIPNPS